MVSPVFREHGRAISRSRSARRWTSALPGLERSRPEIRALSACDRGAHLDWRCPSKGRHLTTPNGGGQAQKLKGRLVGGDALSDPPGCGKWAGQLQNALDVWQFLGRKSKEARSHLIAPPPAHPAAHRAAVHLDTQTSGKSFDLAPKMLVGLVGKAAHAWRAFWARNCRHGAAGALLVR